MQSFGKNSKVCATCQYWQGERKPNNSGLPSGVFTEVSEKGGCDLPINRARKLLNSQTCKQWELWGPLRR